MSRSLSALLERQATSIILSAPGTIHYYVERNDLAQVQHLVRANVLLREQRQSYLGTPLAVAALTGKMQIVQFLITVGANVNARNPDEFDSQSVLMSASTGDLYPEPARLTICRLLLDKGALVRSVDRSGSTALHIAAYWGHASLITLFLARDADLMALDTDGRTPFSEALRGATLWEDGALLRFIRLPIAAGANVNFRGASGDTVLHLAAKAGHVQVIEYLLLKGADPNARDRAGRTPLAVALARNQAPVAAALRAKGAKE